MGRRFFLWKMKESGYVSFFYTDNLKFREQAIPLNVNILIY